MKLRKHHVHIDEYSKDWQAYEKPWEHWQWKYLNGDWGQCLNHPSWDDRHEYRRIPKTITVNDVKVNEPMREGLELDKSYYLADIFAGRPIKYPWAGEEYGYRWLSYGIIHLTEKDAQTHIDAMLKPSRVEK